MSLSVHLGPYLQVPVKSTSVIVRTYACSKMSMHPVPTSTASAFCATCGSPVKAIDTAIPKLDIPYPDHRDFGDLMWCPESSALQAAQKGYVVWLTNQHGFNHTFDGDDQSTELELTATARDIAMQAFLARYEDLIKGATARYGDVVVKYGVVTSCD